MKKAFRPLFRMAAATAVAVALVGIFAQVRKAAPDEDDEEDKKAAIQMPSRVSVQNGETILTVDAETQSRAGITVTSLQTSSTRGQVSVPAAVLSAQELVGLRTSYVTAQTELEKARVNAEVARKEYERLRALYQNGQNTSQKSREAAEGVLRSNEADVRAAGQALALSGAAVRQNWGDAVAQWVIDDAPELKRVLDQSDLLVQVTLPPDEVRSAPRSLVLEVANSLRTPASFVSSFPRIDPRIQGLSFLYLTHSRPGLAPGTTLTAHLPAARLRSGVLVPEQGVVWWQGKAWVYEQTAADRFIRRALPSESPVQNAFLVTKGFAPGERIVQSGAQSLLSEEFRSQIQPED